MEANIQAALQAHQTGQYQSVRATARAFSVPASTLRARLASITSRLYTHESAQILLNAKENTLVRWISRLYRTGFPIAPALVVKIAKEIRGSRF
jgi:hypothetical protein